MGNERQQRRDAAAQTRGFASYYHERNAKAKAKGYEKGYVDQRKARAGLAPLKGRDKPGRVTQPKRDVTSASGMRVVTSRDPAFLRKQIKQAAAYGQSVVVRFTAVGGTKKAPTTARSPWGRRAVRKTRYVRKAYRCCSVEKSGPT